MNGCVVPVEVFKQLLKSGQWVLPMVFLVAAASTEILPMSGDKALQKLMDGNKRYVAAKAAKLTHPNQSPERRTEAAKGQHPFAVIVGCSDSRVPPEIIFDQGIGDLFVIRVAGNIVDDLALGSIEYATEHLGAQLIVVLGHERCGAVEATVKGTEAAGHIGSLVEAIKPAVDKVRKQPGDLLDNAIKSNVKMIVQKLHSSKPILEKLVKKDTLKIVGARYDLDDGTVEIVPQSKSTE